MTSRISIDQAGGYFQKTANSLDCPCWQTAARRQNLVHNRYNTSIGCTSFQILPLYKVELLRAQKTLFARPRMLADNMYKFYKKFIHILQCSMLYQHLTWY